MKIAICFLSVAAVFGSCILFAQDSEVAGNEKVADIIKNYEGRGTLSDGSDPTPPEEALKGFRIREGFEIELVASEPIIGQPLHISWDSKGRMWVTQYLQYQFPAGLKIVEYDNHLRAQFDKMPEPPPHGVKGTDKITVFEDSDGDGKYDKHRDVITGLNIATSAVAGAGGIWVSNPPYLLFYPDADGDANPDGDPEVVLSGFGIEDTHSVMNSLKWGPDGWLYGVNGSTTTGSVTDPATGNTVEWQGQMVWRYHPTTKKFEIYAEGGGNTFSLEIDSAGRVFSGTNNGNTRGMYYPQGSYGKKSWGKHGPLTNPYAFGYFQHMKHEGDDRRFAQAFCIYEGGLYGEDWEGKIIAPNSLHNIVWVSKLQPDGSTFKTVDEDPLVETDDRWFRPVFSGVGPDGCVYIADWYDTRLSHVRPVDDWHKNSGRIYRIKPKGTNPKVPKMDLASASAADLIETFDDPNWVVRKRAVLEYEWNGRYDGDWAGGMVGLVGSKKSHDALSILRLGGAMEDAFPAVAESEEPSIQAAAIRALSVDTGEPLPGKVAAAVSELASQSQSSSVIAEIASMAQNVAPESALPLLKVLSGRDDLQEDPHIPLLIWWAFEAHAEDGCEEILAMAANADTWESEIFREVMGERLARRYAMAGGKENLLSAAKLLETAPDDDARQRLMTGIQLAFQGTAMPELPDALQAQMDEFAKYSGANGLAISIRQGDKEALKKAISLVGSSNSNPIERLELAKVFGEINDPSVVPTLLMILSLDQQSALKRVALQSLAKYDDIKIANTILGRLGSTLPREHEVASTAHRVLAGRVDWAKEFLGYVDRAIVKARNVSTDVVQLLAQHKDLEINAEIKKFWPNSVAASSEANQKEIARIKAIVSTGEGDPAAGKTHYTSRCSACHKLFGEGSDIAPDLTPYERGNLDFWIPAIVDPSLELREGYLQYVANMKDGRILIGMMRDQTPQTVTLQDLAGQETLLSRAGIEKLEASPVSLMPPALLSGMSDEELRDLFAYLMKVAE